MPSPQRPSRPVAHTPLPGTEDWDYLEPHLLAVASQTRCFAEAFGAGDLGFLAGLWHDLGKYNPQFQDYLWDCYRASLAHRGKPQRRVPHAVWGAAFAYLFLKGRGIDEWRRLGLVIKGHHAGLSQAGMIEPELLEFVASNPMSLPTMQKAVVTLAQQVPGGVPPARFRAMETTGRELFVRMLFSALVDADRLATEQHGHPDRGALRGRAPTVEQLRTRIEQSAPRMAPQSARVRQVREDVYRACVDAAVRPPGIFRLTVPTGGGKTRSGLAFALNHAMSNDLRRIVVALPYTSIIDQTVAEYREILGEEAVVEHHSALEVPDAEDEDAASVRRRLATENWDAPVVVTTTVQLFESLFSNRPTKVRKLHRLAKSVVVLDEAQTLPPELLEPTLDALRWLARPVEEGGFGATVVFCTATQPAFDVGPLAELCRDVEFQEIVPAFRDHYAALRRVDYEWREVPMSWSDLAEEVGRESQAMIVLNTRKDALALREELSDGPDVFHLSTLLCGAHRRDVLAEVAARLKRGEPVRLVSTQVVECGVDLDFPVVYRAIGPLDRIVQAAGRCNRNQNRSLGRVVVFEPVDGRAPGGPYRDGLETARLMLRMGGAEGLHNPATYVDYFRRLYRKVDVDRRKIQPLREAQDYPQVAELYKLIEQDTVSVVVPYGDEWERRLDEWKEDPTRRAWRRLQPYLVSLYRHELRGHADWLEEIGDGLYQCWSGAYDATGHRGMVGGFTDPSDLIV